MHVSSLLQAVLKPRKFSSSGMHSASYSKRIRKVVNDPCPARQICLCSPTTHLGSFRCRLHRAPLEQRGRLSPTSEDVKATVSKDPSKQKTIGTAVLPINQMKTPSIGKDAGKRGPLTANHLDRPTPRKFEARPSRLSRVITAEDPDCEENHVRLLSMEMAAVHLV